MYGQCVGSVAVVYVRPDKKGGLRWVWFFITGIPGIHGGSGRGLGGSGRLGVVRVLAGIWVLLSRLQFLAECW